MLQDRLLDIKASKHTLLRDYTWMVNHTSNPRLALGIQFNFGLNIYTVLYHGGKLVASLFIKCCVYLAIAFFWSHHTSRDKSPTNGTLRATGIGPRVQRFQSALERRLYPGNTYHAA